MHDPQVRCHRVRYITFLCRYTIQLYPPQTRHQIGLQSFHLVSRFLESLRVHLRPWRRAFRRSRWRPYIFSLGPAPPPARSPTDRQPCENFTRRCYDFVDVIVSHTIMAAAIAIILSCLVRTEPHLLNLVSLGPHLLNLASSGSCISTMSTCSTTLQLSRRLLTWSVKAVRTILWSQWEATSLVRHCSRR